MKAYSAAEVDGERLRNEFRLSTRVSGCHREAAPWRDRGSAAPEPGPVQAAVTGGHPEFHLITTEKQAEAPWREQPWLQSGGT